MVSIVPNTFLLDLVNHVNGGGNGVANAGGGRNFKFPAKKRDGNNFKFHAKKRVGRKFKFPAKKRSGKSAFQDKYDQEEFERIVQMLQNGKM